MSNDKIVELKKLAEGISLLYVEDNDGLRHNIIELLQKIFGNVHSASDGQEGYELSRARKPNIVITDINMPNVNGLEMARKIKADEPGTKIIYVTAYDDKPHLIEAIEIGVFRYLPKPAKAVELIDALYDAVKAISFETGKQSYDRMLKDIFNYQNNLLLMFSHDSPIIVNQRFLDFFGVGSLNAFNEKFPKLEELLQPHKEFLFTTESGTWFQKAKENAGKLYHAKLINHHNEPRHLIMKLRSVPEKGEMYIVSFDDVTELNLLALYDKEAVDHDKMMRDIKTILKFMKIVRENNADVKLHNFYRGLTITNPAVIVSLDDEEVTVKTSLNQLKIVKLVKNMTISSEVFPKAVLCKSVKGMSFEEQTIVFDKMQFIERSGNDRKYVRLEPEEDHSVTLFFDDRKFYGEIRIVDISIVSVKVELNALPPGIVIGQNIRTSFVLPTTKGPLPINTPAAIYRIDDVKRGFQIVLMYELGGNAHQGLNDYLVSRQVALIREFKGMEVKL